MEPMTGIEPATSRLQIACTASCATPALMVPGNGVEPLPSGFSDRCCGPQVSYPGIFFSFILYVYIISKIFIKIKFGKKKTCIIIIEILYSVDANFHRPTLPPCTPVPATCFLPSRIYTIYNTDLTRFS